MNRLHLTAALSSLLVAVTSVMAVPPDQIRNSPIPPLETPQRGTARQSEVPTSTPPVARPAVATSSQPGATASATTPQPALESDADAAAPLAGSDAATTDSNYEQGSPPADDRDRDALWNSQRMREARTLVLEYTRRSAQTSEREGVEFLRRLSLLPHDQMAEWLKRFEFRVRRVRTQQSIENQARRLMNQEAEAQLAARRQAFANINDYQTLAAEWARQRSQTQSLLSQRARDDISTRRDITVLIDSQIDYDPFAPAFDPMSRSRWTRAAAAASLPGDLPASDPRNYDRTASGPDDGSAGDGGIDANSGGGAAAAAAAAAPAAEAAPSGE